ncbi:MAG: N-6 DNA methylase [Methanobrevibacter sp.]|nr:N-6 DNA methylase [Methanobrevibacter sp.]
MSKFEDIFNELSRTNDRSIIWNNWLDYCININLMQIKSQYAPKDFLGNEEKYYNMFSEWLHGLSTNLESKPYHDRLGELYEENVQSKAKAKDFQQYYTPSTVTEVINELVIDEKTDYTNPFMSDPCCGSGRFLLAAHVKSQGNLICIGQDLDETSCKMAVLNFYSHGVRGSVLHMNTLEGTFYKGWRVNRWLLDGIPVPHIEEINHINEAYNFFGVNTLNKDNAPDVTDDIKCCSSVQTTLDVI